MHCVRKVLSPSINKVVEEMKQQSSFSAPVYKYILGTLIFGLLTWNLWTLIFTGNLMALMSMAIQGTLAILFLTNSKWLKTGVKIWGILLGGSALIGLSSISLAYLINKDNVLELDYLLRKGAVILLWMVAVNEIMVIENDEIFQSRSDRDK